MRKVYASLYKRAYFCTKIPKKESNANKKILSYFKCKNNQEIVHKIICDKKNAISCIYTNRTLITSVNYTQTVALDRYLLMCFVSFTGTTEKIFESKIQLYDIYVDNQNVFSSSHALKDLLKITDADREKLAKLNNQR